MKLAVTPFSLGSIPKLAKNGADIFIVGTGKFANRLCASFSEMDIAKAAEMVHKLHKELIVQLNVIIHDSLLEDVAAYLEFLKKLPIHGIIFGDLAVYQIAKRTGMEHLLIYNPETLNTNHYDAEFWGRQGIKGLVVAKEITLQDIRMIHDHAPIELYMIGHGHLNMFHSRRPLIENFFKYRQEEYAKFVENRNLRLVEELREEAYPVFQDEHGTHIFRDKAMESFCELPQLSSIIDGFIIDGIFKDGDYLNTMVGNYRSLLDHPDEQKAKQLSESLSGDHDSGFLHKKTIYDKEEGEDL